MGSNPHSYTEYFSPFSIYWPRGNNKVIMEKASGNINGINTLTTKLYSINI